MITLILWRPVQSRSVALQFALVTTIALAMSATPLMAQQGPPNFPQQQQQQQQGLPQQQLQQQPQSQVAPGQNLNGSVPVGTTPVGSSPTFVTNAVVSGITNVSSRLVSVCQDFHSGHVIDLMIRNRMRQQHGAFGTEIAPGLMLSAPPSVTQLGDLELLDVNLVADGTPSLGPVIQVTLRNASPLAVGNFQISVVGILGQIHAQCPTVRGMVLQVAAGSVAQFQLQLPSSAMTMGFQGQQQPFDTLVVAIDSFDELLEGNELNNLRIIRRVDLMPIPVAAVSVSTTVTQSSPPQLDAPALNPPADTAIPSPAQPVSPLDSLMLEDNKLESTHPTAAGMSEVLRGTTITGS